MSWYMYYFEQASPKIHNPQGQPNVYTMHRGIWTGRILIQYKDTNIDASVLAPNQDSSLFYVLHRPTHLVARAQQARDRLYSFIAERMELGMAPYLYVYFPDGRIERREPIEIDANPIDIDFLHLDDFFKAGQQGGLFRVTR